MSLNTCMNNCKVLNEWVKIRLSANGKYSNIQDSIIKGTKVQDQPRLGFE